MHHRRELTRAARCAASIALAAGAAHAEVIRWTNPGGGVFVTGSNWQGNAAPGPVDDAVFDLSNTYTVDFPGSIETRTATVRAGTVTFASSAAATYFSDFIVVGDTPPFAPSLTVNSGTLQTDIVSIGAVASASGAMNIQQSGSVTALGDFNIGDLAGGNLNITGGGAARAAGFALAARAGGSGALSVAGAGSLAEAITQITLGLRGPASATVSSGGSLISRGAMVVAAIAGEQASLTVTGAASRVLAEGQLTVGSGGAATISITDADLSTIATSIADNAGSSGTLSIGGTGAVWTLGGILQVGRNATGTLNVTSGAVVNGAAAMFVGAFANANGSALFSGAGTSVSTPAQFQVGSETIGNVTITAGAVLTSGTQGSASGTSGLLGQIASGDGRVTVTGAGSAWNQSGALAVGWSADGRLDILAGASVASASGFVGRNVGGVGAATISGANSRWSNTGELRVGLDPSGLNTGASTLAVTSGGIVQASNLRIGSQATVSGNGTVQAALINAGTVAPGAAGATVGTLSVTGAYTQTSAGRLAIEIGGAGQNDRVAITGAATLGGTLAVTLLNNYSPPIGSSFTVLSAASASGSFSSTSFPPLGGGRTFQVLVQGGSVIVRVVGACPGDINGDGAVDFTDLNVCLAGYGTIYDFNTLAAILGNYGNAC